MACAAHGRAVEGRPNSSKRCQRTQPGTPAAGTRVTATGGSCGRGGRRARTASTTMRHSSRCRRTIPRSAARPPRWSPNAAVAASSRAPAAGPARPGSASATARIAAAASTATVIAIGRLERKAGQLSATARLGRKASTTSPAWAASATSPAPTPRCRRNVPSATSASSASPKRGTGSRLNGLSAWRSGTPRNQIALCQGSGVSVARAEIVSPGRASGSTRKTIA